MTIVARQSQLFRILAAAILAGAIPALGGEIRIQHQGLTVNGNLELAAGQDLSDGVILMLHGTLGHKDMEIMATLQERFLEIGRNSLAINLSLDVDDRRDEDDDARDQHYIQEQVKKYHEVQQKLESADHDQADRKPPGQQHRKDRIATF